MVAEALPPLEQRLEAVARAYGFAAFGIARADAAPETAARLNAWLAEGCHGGMIWMESRAAERGSPQGLWPEVRSVIALGMSYAPAADPLALADAILRLVKDPGRARTMAAAGRKRIDAEFTVQRMVTRMEQLYRGLLETKERRRG